MTCSPKTGSLRLILKFQRQIGTSLGFSHKTFLQHYSPVDSSNSPPRPTPPQLISESAKNKQHPANAHQSEPGPRPSSLHPSLALAPPLPPLPPPPHRLVQTTLGATFPLPAVCGGQMHPRYTLHPLAKDPVLLPVLPLVLPVLLPVLPLVLPLPAPARTCSLALA